MLEFEPITLTSPSTEKSPIKELCDATRSLYLRLGYRMPWIGYLARKGGHYVGSCAFKSAPVNGRVEIAYFTFPEHEGQGIASRMVGHLLEQARAADPLVEVFAQTLPETNASGSILKKLGFTFVSSINHPDDGLVWEWALDTNP